MNQDLMARIPRNSDRHASVVTSAIAATLLAGCQSTLTATAGPSSISAAATTTVAPDETLRTTVEWKPPKVTYRKDTNQLEFERDSVKFEFDSDRLVGDETFKTLGEVRDYLKANPSATKLRVEGHTDSHGTDDYNRALSQRRSTAVVKWLVDNGIDTSRLTSEGKGETAPQVPEGSCKEGPTNAPADCEERVWKKNRRVEVHLVEGELKEDPPPPPPPEAPKPQPTIVAAPKEVVPTFEGVRVGVGYGNIVNGGIFVGMGAPQTSIFESSLLVGWNQAASETASTSALDASLRGRFWLGGEWSPIVEGGVGLAVTMIAPKSDPQEIQTFVQPRLAVGLGHRDASPFRLTGSVGVVANYGSVASQQAAALTVDGKPGVQQYMYPAIMPNAELSLEWIIGGMPKR